MTEDGALLYQGVNSSGGLAAGVASGITVGKLAEKLFRQGFRELTIFSGEVVVGGIRPDDQGALVWWSDVD